MNATAPSASAHSAGSTDASGSTGAPGAPRVTGRLAEAPPGAEDRIVLRIPETDYRLHLLVDSPLEARPGERVTGTVHCQAKRVDVVPSGGRFIEPVFGRPRRIQGRVVGGDVRANTLHVHAGAPVVATLMPAQQASDFKIGQMVCFDVEAGARFEPTR